jgi:modulator of FtsH protease
MTPMLIAGWETFFAAQVGAAATLAGLVFVGVSINLSKIVSSGHLPNRAMESIVILLLNLLAASAFLIPGQTPLALGLEVLAGGVVVWAVLSAMHVQTARTIEPEFRRQGLLAAAQGQLYAIAICVAGAVIAWKGGVGAYVLTAPMLFGYFVAMSNAWVLTIEINR